MEEKRERGETRIKVYAFKVGWHGVLEIDNTQKAIESFVGGPLEKLKIADDFLAIYNGDGFIENLPCTAVLLGEGEGTAIDERGIL